MKNCIITELPNAVNFIHKFLKSLLSTLKDKFILLCQGGESSGIPCHLVDAKTTNF